MHVDGESQTMELNSSPDSISAVERMIDEVRDKYNVSEDMYGNMLVAITEAVTNAIYHGNKSDPSKKVHVTVMHNPHSITFTITDQGPGFDYYNLPDPTSPENIEKECGRGIFLMKHLTDQLIFSENGRVVEMNFRIANA
ncbi:MAG: ATP-binding protein [Bacteroidetes bacterium]|nr:MAG: ATP-binding protein [Bacteroidota bacterium]REK00596.1 MAG: ATP-binding protein [Bacteroidota bacterium]REK35282.1 MAG: ATP-binding protein [Bacteroidota bacterium]REK48358.1 MAG: ATP-binding protein [Bacteroidota bacterium]